MLSQCSKSNLFSFDVSEWFLSPIEWLCLRWFLSMCGILYFCLVMFKALKLLIRGSKFYIIFIWVKFVIKLSVSVTWEKFTCWFSAIDVNVECLIHTHSNCMLALSFHKCYYYFSGYICKASLSFDVLQMFQIHI